MLVSHPNPQLFNHHHKNKKLGTLRPTNQNQSLLELGFNRWSQRRRRCNSTVRPQSVLSVDDKVLKSAIKADRNSNDYRYDVIIIGSGIGGLVAATQLAVKGARVLVLEKYVIPGGSSGFYQRDGYTFDGNLNLITQALAAVGCKMQVIPDPTTVHFHLPRNLSVQVHREYSEFITELISKFPHEKQGILKFYGECWKIFNALNSLELKSLEEPIYLFGQFFKKPLECLTLGCYLYLNWSLVSSEAYYLPQNAGDIARKFIKDPELLSFIDAECFIVSTVNAAQTPMINASMVLCDRHFGGINYPVGGVGGIAKSLAKGLVDQGSEILYKANVTNIIMEGGKAVGVRLSDGREFFAKTIVSNATRWDTFGKLLKGEDLPKDEQNFQKLYVKAPSFLSIHMGVKAEILPPDTDCHHFVLEDNWTSLEKPYGSIFLSIPTILDSSLAPKGRHILHIFTTASMEDWKGMSQEDYEAKKELVAEEIISRLENKLFPGLKSSIVFKEVGTPKTHRRYLARDNGIEKSSPVLDAALLRLLGWLRSLA
ncbi:hypothetical protein RHGRI_006814 [Rhododendron griersonianum]|uniref:prolycopene isomerase n=1 Tax=Rhododendron griersonianum TaxID=479676 RepID=A0AAV6KV02_9ERIC|nr:hypothetical protein RHGRI_006814 [Rhododendron griersonianum]